MLDTLEGIEGIKFAKSDTYGYVTSCPSNLGTGMRASVHIKVPNLTSDGTDKKAKAVCKPLGLSVRGTGGEHTPIGADGTVDISPSARLFIKERDIVAALYQGIQNLMGEEAKAGEGGGKDPYFDLIMNESLARNEWPAELDEHKASEGHQSLMAQVITREMFEELKGLKSSAAGWTIARAINTGTMYPSSFVGCHAGDLESWDLFGKLFHPVVEKYHKGFDMSKDRHITDMDVEKITEDLTDVAKGMIISTRIRVARNLSMFPLNPGGSKATREEILELMQGAFDTLDGELAGTLFRHTTMSDDERQALVDDHFLFRGKDKMQAASGYHEDWPHGRGIFLNKDKTFLLWLNEGDHLRLISMRQGGDVRATFSLLSQGVAAIEAAIRKTTGKEDVFMMHDILGAVTCCPSNLGTGMRGSVHILVPKLIAKHGLEGIDKMAREMNCQARGSSGEHSEVVDRIDVSNWRRLGFKECDLVQDMIRCVNHLAALETAEP